MAGKQQRGRAQRVGRQKTDLSRARAERGTASVDRRPRDRRASQDRSAPAARLAGRGNAGHDRRIAGQSVRLSPARAQPLVHGRRSGPGLRSARAQGRDTSTSSHEVLAWRLLDLPEPCIVTIIDNDRISRRRSNAWPTRRRLEPVEQKCQREVHQHNRPSLVRENGWTVQGWPVHQDGLAAGDFAQRCGGRFRLAATRKRSSGSRHAFRTTLGASLFELG